MKDADSFTEQEATMRLTAEQANVHNLLKDTVVLLCKQLVPFNTTLSIKAVIGITTDNVNGFYFDISENVLSDKSVIGISDDMPEHGKSPICHTSSSEDNALADYSVKSNTTYSNTFTSFMGQDENVKPRQRILKRSRDQGANYHYSKKSKTDGPSKEIKEDETHKMIKCEQGHPEEKLFGELSSSDVINEVESEASTTFLCKLCEQSFQNQKNCDDHFLQVHSSDIDRCFICPRCDLKFTDAVEFNAHLIMHISCKPFSCKKCEAVVQHKHCNQLRCEKCQTEYICKYKDHSCFKCGKKLNGPSRLLIHISTCKGWSVMVTSQSQPIIQPTPVRLFAASPTRTYHRITQDTSLTTLGMNSPLKTDQSTEFELSSDIKSPNKQEEVHSPNYKSSFESAKLSFNSPVYSGKPNALLMNLILTSEVFDNIQKSPEKDCTKVIEVKPQSPTVEKDCTSIPTSHFESAQKLLDKVLQNKGSSVKLVQSKDDTIKGEEKGRASEEKDFDLGSINVDTGQKSVL